VGSKAVGIILGNRKVARGKQPIIIQQKYKAARVLFAAAHESAYGTKQTF
jgi:vancomycin permeability regulator SanA